MDISEKYIKMCEKAVEIQLLYNAVYGLRPHNPLDFVIAQVDKKNIWLPRQDQLQGMAKEENVHVLLWQFARWQDEAGEDGLYPHQFITFEQLWLAFIMETQFNKRWSRKQNEWVSIGSK